MAYLGLKKWDPSTIREYSSILFVGGRRTGKSCCMRDIMWNIKDRVYDTSVYSGRLNSHWESYTPFNLVHYCLKEFHFTDLERDIKTQEKRVKDAEENKTQPPSTLMVFDDVEFLNIYNHDFMRGLMHYHKDLKTYCFSSIQTLIDIPLEVRKTFDYIVLSIELNSCTITAIQHLIAQKQSDKVVKDSLLDMQNYQVLVLDCHPPSNNIEDTLFWYKAQDRGSFTMGSSDIWNATTEYDFSTKAKGTEYECPEE